MKLVVERSFDTVGALDAFDVEKGGRDRVATFYGARAQENAQAFLNHVQLVPTNVLDAIHSAEAALQQAEKEVSGDAVQSG